MPRLFLPFCACALALLVLGTTTAFAQTPSSSGARELPARWLRGYVRTVAGEWILYPWAYPGQTKTLLSRATDGRMAVEWEGEAVPAGDPGERVTFLWHGGTASGDGAHQFTLSVNGRRTAVFRSGRTADDREWSVAGEGGAVLSFKTTRVGQFNELFGFMWLTAPRAFFGSGTPRFVVVGEAAGSQDYYLGPQEPVESWTRVVPEEAVFADGQRALRVGVSHVGAPQQAAVRSGTRTLWSGTIEPGYTTILVGAGPNAEATLPLSVAVGSAMTFDGAVRVSAVRPRAMHLLPHSHVDIGYSDPQPEVERKQWKNLREALALARATASYPPEARFKWNVEGLWSVESYLAQASPDDRRVFAEAVRDGSMGLQANYTNILTGLATPVELERWTDAAKRLRAELGTGPIRSAMHSDIPGLSWASVAALAQGGVRYFSSGPNYMPGLPDGGDRIGTTLKALGDAPFWWTSPSGEERLLVWVAGRGYSWFHGLNTGRATDRSRDSILDYVRDLVSRGYPYDLIQVRYTIGGDNGPVDPALPDFVKRWNEQFSTPRLVIDTAERMFDTFERRHGAELPVRAGDMTPYWEDGAISSAGEEAAVRAAARELQQAETLAVLRGTPLPRGERDEAWRHVLLWREHTWGAADSITQPDRADVVAQWEYKRRFSTESARRAAELMRRALAAAPSPAATVDVINTLSWPRGGLVFLPADLSRAGDRVTVVPPPDAGAGVLRRDAPTARVAQSAPVRRATTVELALPSQRLQDGRLAVWIDSVPAMSSIRLRVGPGEPERPAGGVTATDSTLDNGVVRIGLGPDRASIGSLAWTGAPGREFVSGSPGLLRYLYVPGRDPSTAVGNDAARVSIEDAGPLVATLRIDSVGRGARGLVQRVSLAAGSDRLALELTVDKTAVRTKESAHAAFPFAVPEGVVRADQGTALVALEHDQLPGSCREFIGVQSAIDVSGHALGISLVSLDAPIIELGAMTDERQNDRGTRNWRERVAPGSTLYAYLLNNYWHTNYKADQSGRMSFRFVVRPHAGFDAVALRRFSDEHDAPLLTAPSAPDAPRITPTFTVSGDPVTVVSMEPDDDLAIAVRLFNPSSSPAAVTVHSASDMIVAEPTGTRPLPGGRLVIPPRAIRLVRLSGR